MLTIIALLIVTAIVVGMVKINQLTSKTEILTQLCVAIESDLRKVIEDVYREMDRKDENLRRIIEDTNRDITMVERTIINRIDQVNEEHNKHEEEIYRSINNEVENIHQHENEIYRAIQNEIEDTRSYIDSRIDKVVAKGTIESSKKQVING
jgi:G3E family GTPase